MIIIEYPKCSTCKKALKYLDDNKIEYTRRNIVENNPTEEEIKTWIKNNDIEIKKLFNTSGIKYRELNLKEKLKTMSEKEKISLLSTDGMLVKRPILLTKDKILIGFKEDECKKITR